MSLLACSVFYATLIDLSERSRTAVEVTIRRSGQRATVRPRSGTIIIPRSLLDAPPDRQSWVAAHEFAHIVLYPHEVAQEGSESARRRASTLVYLSLGALAGAVMSVGVAAPLWVPWLLAALAVVLLGAAFRAHAVWSLPREVAADLLAARWGYPVTPSIAAHLAAVESPADRLWLLRPFRSHPYPAARVLQIEHQQPGSTQL